MFAQGTKQMTSLGESPGKKWGMLPTPVKKNCYSYNPSNYVVNHRVVLYFGDG